jgi:hypothetical protein
MADKKDEHDNESGLPKFVRENRAKQDRTKARLGKLIKTSRKATNKDGNQGKR